MAAPGWLSDAVELFIPTGCVSCRRWIPRDRHGPAGFLCVACRSRMRAGPWPRCPRCHWPRGTGRIEDASCAACAAWPEVLRGARFAWLLEPPADDLVHGLKYEGWRGLASFMAETMAALDLPRAVAGAGAICVTPVPTTPERLRVRGYNQAELLARGVAARLGLPLVLALERGGTARSQTALTPAQRRRNVLSVFSPTPEASRVRGGSVLLIDDVLTTGATVSEAAERLSAAGARDVWVITFARAVPPGARRAA